MPKVSVIVPVYNVEKYLPSCLDGLINQTFKDIEIICINDGSTDASEKILDEYALMDKRIKVFYQQNSGLSLARNNGLKQATGDYIYFLDSDDVMHPQLLEISVYMMEKYNADWVNFDFYRGGTVVFQNVKNFDKIKVKITSNPVMLGTHKEKYRISFNVWAKLYKKELLEGIDFIPKIQYEDFPHTFAIMAKRPKTVVIKEKLYLYRINEESISFQKAKPQQIRDYRLGIGYILMIYNNSKLKKEFDFLKRKFLPNILKQQYGKCIRSPENVRSEMLEEFALELKEIDAINALSWRGHKLKRYLKYKKLMKLN